MSEFSSRRRERRFKYLAGGLYSPTWLYDTSGNVVINPEASENDVISLEVDAETTDSTINSNPINTFNVEDPGIQSISLEWSQFVDSTVNQTNDIFIQCGLADSEGNDAFVWYDPTDSLGSGITDNYIYSYGGKEVDSGIPFNIEDEKRFVIEKDVNNVTFKHGWQYDRSRRGQEIGIDDYTTYSFESDSSGIGSQLYPFFGIHTYSNNSQFSLTNLIEVVEVFV